MSEGEGSNYTSLIRSWHSKASDIDYFSKFMFEYLAFIACIRTQPYLNISSDGARIQTDRARIQKLKQKQKNEIKEKYLKVIQENSALNKAWKHIKNELEKEPLKNSSRKEELKWWNCSEEKLQKCQNNNKKGVIHDLKDWGNMVELWYSIRNNLFHATKSPSIGRDKFLVEYGYKTLSSLVEILIEENEREYEGKRRV